MAIGCVIFSVAFPQLVVVAALGRRVKSVRLDNVGVDGEAQAPSSSSSLAVIMVEN